MAEDCDGHQLKTSSTVTSSPHHGGCQMKFRSSRVGCSKQNSGGGVSGAGSSNSYCKRRSLKQSSCDDVTTVVTCEGDINDPEFRVKFDQSMIRLKNILMQDREDWLKVNKIEPWNSVRVTLTIPREAAQRLRSLAAAGDTALQALGILSVQVEGDQVISLQLRSRFGGEPQEILLTTSSNNSEPGPSSTSCSTTGGGGAAVVVSQLLGAAIGTGQQSTSNGVFRSPNVVAPGGAGIPPSAKIPPVTGPSPYPFTSMTHAAQAQQSRESMSTHQNFTPPPPYPVKNNYPPSQSTSSSPSPASPTVINNSSASNKVRQHNSVMSSPLLVNLLQNDGSTTSLSPVTSSTTSTTITNTVRTSEIDCANKPRTAVIQPPSQQQQQQHPLPPPTPQPLSQQQRQPPIQQQQPINVVRHRNPVQMNMNSKNTTTIQPPTPQQQAVVRNRFNGPTSAVATTTTVVTVTNSSATPSVTAATASVKTFQHNQPQSIVSSRPSVQRFSQITPVVHGYSQFTANKNKVLTEASGDVKTEVNSDKKLIINPLTGELEPMPSESSESETDEHLIKEDPFVYSPSPGSRVFSDDDVTPAHRRLDGGSEESDSELGVSSVKRRNSTMTKHGVQQEKIKLRLKLEKCEPVNQSYKVDVSFINSPTPRKPLPVAGNRLSNITTATTSATSSTISTTTTSNTTGSNSPSVNVTSSSVLTNNVEEPRVPPLHISLRGRNAAVVKQSPWSVDEEDEEDDEEEEEEEDDQQQQQQNTAAVAAATTTVQAPTNNNNTTTTATISVDFHKVNRKKVRTGREEFAMGGYKKSKLKNDILKLKIPSYNLDDMLRVKRKESKKLKMKQIIEDETKHNLKMDSEEFISRTLKEGINLEKRKNNKLFSDEVVVTDNTERTMKDRYKKLSLKIKNDYNKEVSSVCVGESELEASSATVAAAIDAVTKKPQEIGGKIKSELSSKIDRVSGKLKNDLSFKVTKDNSCKKLKDDKISVVRKLVSGVVEHEGFTKARRRHSGDSTAESQAQKVKNRSSSSDQLLGTPVVTSNNTSSCTSYVTTTATTTTTTTTASTTVRRLDSFARRIKKESVIERLRKDKLNKVFALNRKSSTEHQQHGKRVHSNNMNMLAVKQQQQQQQQTTVQQQQQHEESVTCADVVVSPVKEITSIEEEVTSASKVTSVTEDVVVQGGGAGVSGGGNGGVGGESPANQGNTQGEDSGIESMDALSEKSPNQGESPCRSERKDEESQKELEISKPEEKKGQNHDRTNDGVEVVGGEGARKSCLISGGGGGGGRTEELGEEEEEGRVDETAAKSNNDNKIAEETISSQVGDYPLDKRLTDSFEVKIREAFLAQAQAQEGLAAKILDTAKDVDCEDVLDRFRVNPPLYTYAKREDSLSPSPTNIDCPDNRLELKCAAETLDEDSNTSSVSLSKKQTQRKGERKKPSSQQQQTTSDSCLDTDETSNTWTETQGMVRSLRNNNKSLLEQLLIEIPPEESRRTRSWHRLGGSPGNTPKSSPRSPRPSPTGSMKGKRKAQTAETEDNHRPNKRKCSENAAELIKACMGVDEKKILVNNKIASPALVVKKVLDVDSSDDEPLIDLAGKTSDNVDEKSTFKSKTKQQDEENKNNNKSTTMIKQQQQQQQHTQLSSQPSINAQQQQQQGGGTNVKVASEITTRRSVRQNNNGSGLKQDVSRSLRSTRSTTNPIVESEVNKRRRTSRDGK